MRNDYGCCDLTYLVANSGKANTVRVKNAQNGLEYFVPVGIFDNREDFTTFARSPVPSWKAEDMEKIRVGLQGAMDNIAAV